MGRLTESDPTGGAQAKALGYLSADQTLQNLRAYPVEEEQTVMLKDNRTVMLRPPLSAT